MVLSLSVCLLVLTALTILVFFDLLNCDMISSAMFFQSPRCTKISWDLKFFISINNTAIDTWKLLLRLNIEKFSLDLVLITLFGDREHTCHCYSHKDIKFFWNSNFQIKFLLSIKFLSLNALSVSWVFCVSNSMSTNSCLD